MKQINMPESQQELTALCGTVRKLVEQNKYQVCRELIQNAMGRYPHAPEPHNLMGILLEMEGDHLYAMKHFRAAWALDPTYIAARYNLNRFATFFPKGKCAFDETDCSKEKQDNLYKVEYDAKGIGHVIRRD
ncbi:hypothetical protein [Cellulosilyticum sp. I15G10I2]|uniref:hypothetical protein n=1 Tax=Cellulosilyticum sp. I15G10I2 TaxID=1892843 RepID=UPI000AFFF248|nr:hypothetical protein [Cellulosilyticum sp. I15G10I2]